MLRAHNQEQQQQQQQQHCEDSKREVAERTTNGLLDGLGRDGDAHAAGERRELRGGPRGRLRGRGGDAVAVPRAEARGRRRVLAEVVAVDGRQRRGARGLARARGLRAGAREGRHRVEGAARGVALRDLLLRPRVVQLLRLGRARPSGRWGAAGDRSALRTLLAASTVHSSRKGFFCHIKPGLSGQGEGYETHTHTHTHPTRTLHKRREDGVFN